jgi:hypothetical protein
MKCNLCGYEGEVRRSLSDFPEVVRCIRQDRACSGIMEKVWRRDTVAGIHPHACPTRKM